MDKRKSRWETFDRINTRVDLNYPEDNSEVSEYIGKWREENLYPNARVNVLSDNDYRLVGLISLTRNELDYMLGNC